jgi:hypothetical protein
MFVFYGLDHEKPASHHQLDDFGPRTSKESLRLSEIQGRQPFYSCSPQWYKCPPGSTLPFEEPTSRQSQRKTWHEEMTMAFFDSEKNKFDLPFEELVLSYNQYLPVGWAGEDIAELGH